MTDTRTYAEHLETLDGLLGDALERAGKAGLRLKGVLFHAGREATYHADDEAIAFRSTPHYRRWVPLEGPEHAVLARPGKKPLVVRFGPRDFWLETLPLAPSYWQEHVELVEIEKSEQLADVIGSASGLAFVGGAREVASELGFEEAQVEPDALMMPLDWHRAVKTPFEVALIEAAGSRAAEGHRLARKAFEAGASEIEIHWTYLQATGHLERELPFAPITALGDKISILHYQNKRGSEAGPQKAFMLDAGAVVEGYASDITRTWAHSEASPLYARLVEGVDALERELAAMVAPGASYVELHVAAHRKVGALLAELGLVSCSAEEAFDRGLTRTFLPHGVGHHLGIQVHDVGGHQEAPEGGKVPPPPEYPFLRNTRTLEPGHVVTIEPGVYFTPVLLDALRAGDAAKLVNWRVVKELVPYGGVRIEDDVLCTADGFRDLTRGAIQGPRGS